MTWANFGCCPWGVQAVVHLFNHPQHKFGIVPPAKKETTLRGFVVNKKSMFFFPHTENNFLTWGSLAELPKHSQLGVVRHTRNNKLDVSVSQQNLLMSSHEACTGKGSEHNTGMEWGSPISPSQLKEAPGYGEKKINPSLYLVYNQIPASHLMLRLPALQEEQGRTKCALTGGWEEGRVLFCWQFSIRKPKWEAAS